MAVVPFCCTLPFVVMVKAARHHHMGLIAITTEIVLLMIMQQFCSFVPVFFCNILMYQNGPARNIREC